MAKIEFLYTGPTGQSLTGTLQRLSDSLYRAAASETFITPAAFADKAWALPEDTDNLGSYRQTLTADTWQDGLYAFRVCSSTLAIGGRIFSVKNGYEVEMGTESPINNVYHADIQFIKNQIAILDEYTVVWFLNGVPLAGSSVTTPTLQVVRRSNGSDLIPATALIQVGSSSAYKLDVNLPTQRQSSGDSYLIIASATINGATRVFSTVLGRDA